MILTQGILANDFRGIRDPKLNNFAIEGFRITRIFWVMSKSVYSVIWFLFGLYLIGCQSNNSFNPQQIIDAQLLSARLVNYRNQTYITKPPWIEYNIALTNSSNQLISLCESEATLLIRGSKKEIIDSLRVYWGKKEMMPRSKDTIRIDKPVNRNEEQWVNPSGILCNCPQVEAKSKSLEPIFFEINRGEKFQFNIE